MNTTELKKLAEAATPGRWQAHHDHGWLVVESDSGDLYIKIEKGSAAKKHIADARYIAAANPAAILKLLQTNAELVEALKLISIQDQGCGGNVTGEEAWRASQHIAHAALAKAEGGEL